MLQKKTINLVKSTLPVLENAGVAVTEYFYNRMFSAHPELQNIFNISNQVSGRQQFALFSALASYAKYIDDLDQLTPLVERVANKHSSFYIQKEHYPIVGHHLIATLKELAPETFTEEVAKAWEEAYAFLAHILSNRENTLYEEKAIQRGGWRGTRNFYIAEKIRESELVFSFILKPEDQGPIAHYKPGQYLGIKLKPDANGFEEIRQYSLSDKPNENFYRISVKKESQPRPGKISNYLHKHCDVGSSLEIFPPAGDFYLQSTQKPNVFISAGVGITPMMAMLEVIAETGAGSPTWFLHACQNSQQYSFKERIEILCEQYEYLNSETWYKWPEPKPFHTRSGYMDLMPLANKLPLENGDFYICGPTEFMASVKKQLLFLDVQDKQIHYELFGPHKDL